MRQTALPFTAGRKMDAIPHCAPEPHQNLACLGASVPQGQVSLQPGFSAFPILKVSVQSSEIPSILKSYFLRLASHFTSTDL